MKTKFVVPYVLGGLLTLSAWTNSKMSASYNNADSEDSAKNKISAVLPENKPIKIEELQLPELKPYATEAILRNKDVLYVMNTGDTIRRQGGTLAWRNNNPGNLVYGGFARENGAIGKGPRSFAVFPDEETGRAALTALLRTDKYNRLSISKAIEKYAPPKENDVELYRRRLRQMTGLDLNLKLSSLNSDQMERVVDAICVIEGWRVGHEQHMKHQGNMMAMAKSKVICDSMSMTM